MMSYRRRRGLLWPMLALASGLPQTAMAQTADAPNGPLGRLLDYSVQQPWYSVALFAVMSAAVGVGAFFAWYRFGLVGDLRAQRTPNNTRLVAAGLAMVVAAAAFTLVTHAGVLYLIVFAILGAALVMFGSATVLGISIIVAMLLIVAARFYGWL